MANLYLVQIDTLEQLQFQNIPDNLSQKRKPKINDMLVIGKNLPDYGYSAGTDDLKFELDFYSDAENKQDVRDKCNWLRSLAYNSGQNKAPSKVKLIFGDLFRNELWIVKEVAVDYSLFNKAIGHLPQQAYVSITLGLAPEGNITKTDVRERRIF